jgi:hypothetical protein
LRSCCTFLQEELASVLKRKDELLAEIRTKIAAYEDCSKKVLHFAWKDQKLANMEEAMIQDDKKHTGALMTA